jgi:hypothetical protein
VNLEWFFVSISKVAGFQPATFSLYSKHDFHTDTEISERNTHLLQPAQAHNAVAKHF